MRVNDAEIADERILLKTSHTYRTLQFDNYEELERNLSVNDYVLVHKNGGRYMMKVAEIDDTFIVCSDNAGTYVIRKNADVVNLIEKVLELTGDDEGEEYEWPDIG